MTRRVLVTLFGCGLVIAAAGGLIVLIAQNIRHHDCRPTSHYQSIQFYNFYYSFTVNKGIAPQNTKEYFDFVGRNSLNHELQIFVESASVNWGRDDFSADSLLLHINDDVKDIKIYTSGMITSHTKK
jgi:hypothetical protein